MKSPIQATLLTGIFLIVHALGADPAGRYTAQDGSRIFQTAITFALKSDHEAIHDCFMASYLRASSPFLGGEDCEAITCGLSELLFRGGDHAFSQALAVERPEVIAAVKFWIRQSPGFYHRGNYTRFAMDDYAKTKHLLDSVAKVDFPLNENSKRRPALLKQLSQ